MKIRFVALLLLTVALLGCTTTPPAQTGDAETPNWIPESALVQQFLETNPDANLTSEAWGETEIESQKLFIIDKCGKLLSQNQYYFVRIESENETLFAWMQEGKAPECFKLETDQSMDSSDSTESIEIKNIFASVLSDSNAAVSWVTKSKSTSSVEFGTDANALDTVASSSEETLVHRVSLNGLLANTKYYFRVMSGNLDGNAASEIQSFTTLRDPAEAYSTGSMELSDIAVEQVTPHSAVISWRTNQPATTEALLGTESRSLTNRFSRDTNSIMHGLVLEDLNFATEYFFQVHSQGFDENGSPDSGNEAFSGISSFQTSTELDLKFEIRSHAFGARGSFVSPYSLQAMDYELLMGGDTYVGVIPMKAILSDSNETQVCMFEFEHNSNGSLTQSVIYQFSQRNAGTCFGQTLERGNYSFSITIDSDEVLAETNETNNMHAQSFRVA